MSSGRGEPSKLRFHGWALFYGTYKPSALKRLDTDLFSKCMAYLNQLFIVARSPENARGVAEASTGPLGARKVSGRSWTSALLGIALSEV